MPMQKHIVRKFDSFDEMRLAHIEDWQKLSSAKRMAEAWKLVLTYRELRGIKPVQPRFQRVVTNVRRARS